MQTRVVDCRLYRSVMTKASMKRATGKRNFDSLASNPAALALLRDRMSLIVAQLDRLEFRMMEAYGPDAQSRNHSVQRETHRHTYEGTVKDVLASKGFGFVKRDDGKATVYFHCSDLDETLLWNKSLRGQRVRFEIVETQKGARAVAVRKAE